jgi:hypothetical protein
MTYYYSFFPILYFAFWWFSSEKAAIDLDSATVSPPSHLLLVKELSTLNS